MLPAGETASPTRDLQSGGDPACRVSARVRIRGWRCEKYPQGRGDLQAEGDHLGSRVDGHEGTEMGSVVGEVRDAEDQPACGCKPGQPNAPVNGGRGGEHSEAEVETAYVVAKPGGPLKVTLKVNGGVVAEGTVPISVLWYAKDLEPLNAVLDCRSYRLAE